MTETLAPHGEYIAFIPIIEEVSEGGLHLPRTTMDRDGETIRDNTFRGRVHAGPRRARARSDSVMRALL